MLYVYVIKNLRSAELYYGYTNNLKRRFAQHNKDNKWKLVYYEAFLSEKDTRQRERKLKDYGQSRTHLKKRINNSILI